MHQRDTQGSNHMTSASTCWINKYEPKYRHQCNFQTEVIINAVMILSIQVYSNKARTGLKSTQEVPQRYGDHINL
jgi:hypothetical protein